MSNVAQLRAASTPEHLLTKQQLARHLGRSTRWIELRVREGMPSVDPTERYPTRRFRLAAVEAWIAEGARKPDPGERIEQLEAKVARLAATVEDLQRRVG